MDENKDNPENDELEYMQGISDMHIITIVFDEEGYDAPKLDLGDTSPLVAIALLQSAIETLQMLVPPVDVSYKGMLVCHSSFEILDEDEN
jgi:hypothetical protein